MRAEGGCELTAYGDDLINEPSRHVHCRQGSVACSIPPGLIVGRPGPPLRIVQDLILRCRVVEFRCERWLTPDGTVLTAPLPDSIDNISDQNCVASFWRKRLHANKAELLKVL